MYILIFNKFRNIVYEVRDALKKPFFPSGLKSFVTDYRQQKIMKLDCAAT
jgi:hypothetical protein